MGRFRRVFRRAVRRPVRRRRYFRRRKFNRRRSRYNSGNLKCKFTRVQSVTVDCKKVGQWELKFVPTEFPEFLNLAPNFESYRATKLRVRVVPQHNVATRDTGIILPAYCMFPWHSGIPAGVSRFNDFLSIDKAKFIPGYRQGSQIYNLNTLVNVYDSDGQVSSNEVQWGKRIEITSDRAYYVQHYGGGLGFQALSDVTGVCKVHYNVVYDVYCTFYNQKVLKGTTDVGNVSSP